MPNRHHEIAQRIQYACDQVGIPSTGAGRQGAISKSVGCTSEAARKWLHGYTRPSHRYLNDLADLLSVDIAWLEFGTEPETARHKNVTIQQEVSAAVHLVHSMLSLRGITLADPPNGSNADMIAVYGGQLYPVSVSMARDSDDGHKVDVSRKLDANSVIFIVVVSGPGYGDVDQVVAPYDTIRDLATARGSYYEFNIQKESRTYYLGDTQLTSKIVMKNIFT